MRDLFAAGLFHPDSPTFSRSRESFVAKKFAVSVEGQGNSWVDFWQQGQALNPPTRFKMLLAVARARTGRSRSSSSAQATCR